MAEKIFKVAGHPEKELVFYPFTSCGSIQNGVGFANGQKAGGWVIAYEDLLQMVELAKQARAQQSVHPTAAGDSDPALIHPLQKIKNGCFRKRHDQLQ